MTPEDLRSKTLAAGFTLPDDAVPVLVGYLAELHRWNKVMNLVGARHEAPIFELFMDSFHLADFLHTLSLPDNPECRDLGAGAGLPGIPLRAVWNTGQYTLIESREKRALFLKNILARFPLPGTTVFHGRAEQFQGQPADIILSRAFMPPETLLPFVQPMLAPGGLLILLLNALLAPELLNQHGWTRVAAKTYTVGSNPRVFEAVQPNRPNKP